MTRISTVAPGVSAGTKKLTALLTMGLLLSLTACGNRTPSSSTSNSASQTQSSVAPSATAENGSVTAAATDNTTAVATAEQSPGEQVTETGAAEATDATPASQPLALKIVDTPAEPTSQWKEGVNYTRLVPAQPTSATPGQVEVTEVFWYGCPHCYALDSYLENWRKNGKAAYVNFVRIPVMWGAVHRTHARVFYTAEMLGKLDELHTAIFQEIHQKNDPLTTADRIESFFTSHGVTQADFQKAFSSLAIEASLKRAENLGLRYKVESVPLIIINGKYVTDVGKAGSPQQLLNLINDLASRERAT